MCNVSQVVLLTLGLKKFPALFIVVSSKQVRLLPEALFSPYPRLTLASPSPCHHLVSPCLARSAQHPYPLVPTSLTPPTRPTTPPPPPSPSQPAYQVFFMVLAIAVGGIYFREFWMLTLVQWVLFLFGVCLCLGGVVVLSKSDVEQNQHISQAMLQLQVRG